MKPHSSKDIARAVSLFFAVRGAVRTTLAQGKRLDPYSWLRIETLKFIRSQETPTMGQVAEYLSITAPSATSLVSALVKEGLVRRQVSVKDRRASCLSLTPKGKRVLAATIARGTALLAELFGTLSPTELAAFTRALERILDKKC